MKELIRTNDPKKITWLAEVLAERGIDAVVQNTDTSNLEEQLGKFSHRIMVDEEDFEFANGLFILSLIHI